MMGYHREEIVPTKHSCVSRKRRRCWTEESLSLQFPSTAFDFQKPNQGLRDDFDLLSSLPCRILQDWELRRLSFDDNQSFQPCVSLPVETDSLEGHVLVGTLKPMHAQQLPVQITLKKLDCFIIDKSRGYRGYWVITTAARYWLQRPSTKRTQIPRLRIRVGGVLMDDQDDSDVIDVTKGKHLEKIQLPTQEEMHAFHRAQLGLLSNLLDTLLPNNDSSYANMLIQNTPKELYDLLSPNAQVMDFYHQCNQKGSLYGHPFDLDLLMSSSFHFLHQHVEQMMPDMKKSKFFKAAKRDTAAKFSFEQLTKSALAAEKRSKQYPWGESLRKGDSLPNVNLAFPLEVELMYNMHKDAPESALFDVDYNDADLSPDMMIDSETKEFTTPASPDMDSDNGENRGSSVVSFEDTVAEKESVNNSVLHEDAMVGTSVVPSVDDTLWDSESDESEPKNPYRASPSSSDPAQNVGVEPAGAKPTKKLRKLEEFSIPRKRPAKTADDAPGDKNNEAKKAPPSLSSIPRKRKKPSQDSTKLQPESVPQTHSDPHQQDLRSVPKVNQKTWRKVAKAGDVNESPSVDMADRNLAPMQVDETEDPREFRNIAENVLEDSQQDRYKPPEFNRPTSEAVGQTDDGYRPSPRSDMGYGYEDPMYRMERIDPVRYVDEDRSYRDSYGYVEEDSMVTDQLQPSVPGNSFGASCYPSSTYDQPIRDEWRHSSSRREREVDSHRLDSNFSGRRQQEEFPRQPRQPRMLDDESRQKIIDRREELRRNRGEPATPTNEVFNRSYSEYADRPRTPEPPVVQSHTKKYKLFATPAGSDAKPICAFFLSPQGCRNGDNCKFLHTGEPASGGDRPAPRSDGPRKVCAFFLTARGCRNGDKCGFLHTSNGDDRRPADDRAPPRRRELHLSYCEPVRMSTEQQRYTEPPQRDGYGDFRSSGHMDSQGERRHHRNDFGSRSPLGRYPEGSEDRRFASGDRFEEPFRRRDQSSEPEYHHRGELLDRDHRRDRSPHRHSPERFHPRDREVHDLDYRRERSPPRRPEMSDRRYDEPFRQREYETGPDRYHAGAYETNQLENGRARSPPRTGDHHDYNPGYNDDYRRNERDKPLSHKLQSKSFEDGEMSEDGEIDDVAQGTSNTADQVPPQEHKVVSNESWEDTRSRNELREDPRVANHEDIDRRVAPHRDDRAISQEREAYRDDRYPLEREDWRRQPDKDLSFRNDEWNRHDDRSRFAQDPVRREDDGYHHRGGYEAGHRYFERYEDERSFGASRPLY